MNFGSLPDPVAHLSLQQTKFCGKIVAAVLVRIFRPGLRLAASCSGALRVAKPLHCREHDHCLPVRARVKPEREVDHSLR